LFSNDNIFIDVRKLAHLASYRIPEARQVKNTYKGETNQGVKRQLLYEGFTLIELLLVITAIGILSAIALPSYGAYRERLKIMTCQNDIQAIAVAIKGYYSERYIYPNTLSEVGYGGKTDPWGNPYEYLNIADGDKKNLGKVRKDHFMVPLNTDYDLYSMGPDGLSIPPLTAKASRDDIVRANNGQYIGPASEY
jgi:general secretion pathway protein G